MEKDYAMLLRDRTEGLIKKVREMSWVQKAVRYFLTLEWSEKILFLFGVTFFLLMMTGPYALLYRQTGALLSEAQLRGLTLARYLAAGNQAAFTRKQEVLYSVEGVIHERGVEDAMITDLEGTILSPVERFGQTLPLTRKVENPNQCQRFKKGFDLEFVCPLFRWLESSDGFSRQTIGLAYLKYNARESLDLLGSQTFQMIKYIFLFAFLIGLTAYAFLALTQKSLLDFKFAVRTAARSGNPLDIPRHFKALREIALEIQELQQQKAAVGRADSPAPADASSLAGEMMAWLGPLLKEPVLLLDERQQIVHCSKPLREKWKAAPEGHILRALKDSPFMEPLIDFVGALGENPEEPHTQTIKGLGSLRGESLNLQGKKYFLIRKGGTE
ncbi:MAG: hypothetical protein HY609_04555 [Deltaproteobacteria bacterium]|nr:hypothetical protein [Deltaproteobacteria bacterium]MBI4224181.1 hypothetical protein [Deltaproteobacteria bacterium]